VFRVSVRPDYEGLLRNLRRAGTPDRVYHLELLLDQEVQDALVARFDLNRQLARSDPRYREKVTIALYRFLGYDAIIAPLGGLSFPHYNSRTAADTAELARADGRTWINESSGSIASWEDFDRYPWPNPARLDTSLVEWYTANVPDDMCLVGWCHNVYEETSWLIGYQPLCYALYDQPDLVNAVFTKVGSIYLEAARIYTQFDRVKILFDGDDMGFRTGTLISPRVLIEKSLPWHKQIAETAHANGKLYLLHSCGKLDAIMPALINDVKIDGKHSFEDVIEPVTEAKRRWGDRIAIIGGIDVDFLVRATPEQVKQRVRETLDICLPAGGYCLGSGNTIANYIPLDNYLAMLEAGREYGA
jgi:uroporphyrinogen decarboxylase